MAALKLFRTIIAKPACAGLTIVALMGILAGPTQAAESRVGVAAAVNPQAVGIPPGESDRALFIGANVLHDERIRTGAKGRTQVVFLDGSALTIGPNADMVIDEFVYDPNAKVGTLAVTAAKGAFRFVGGRISKKKPVVIKTPTAVIGIRGGIAMFQVGASTTATFLFGEEMQVTAGDVTRTVDKPGFAVDVPAGADAPSDPKPAAPASLTQAVVGLEAAADSDTGVETPPVDQDVASSQLSELGSDRTPTELETTPVGDSGGDGSSNNSEGGQGDKKSTNTQNSRQTRRLGTSSLANLTTTVSKQTTSVLQSVLQNSQLDSSTNQTGSAATTISSTGVFVGRIKSSNSASAPNGTLDPLSNRNIAFTGGAIVSDRFLVDVNGSALKLPVGGPGSVTNFFNGQGSLGNGAVSGSSYVSSDGDFIAFELRLLDQNGARATAFAGVPTPPSQIPTSGFTDFSLTSDFVLESNIAFLSDDFGGGIAPLPNVLNDNHGIIIWDVSGSSNAQRAVGFLQGYISGNGANQQSVVGLIAGQVLFDNQGRPHIAAKTRGSAHLSNGKSYFFQGDVSSTPGGDGSHFFGTSGELHFGLQSATVFSNGSTTPSATQISDGANSSSYYGNVYASSIVDSDAKGTRVTESLSGFAAGAGEGYDSAGALTGIDPLLTTDADLAFVNIHTNKSTNKVLASFGVSNLLSSNDVVLYFGDDSTSAGRSVYVDNDGFGAIESTTLSTYNANAVSNHRAYMFSDNAIDSDGLLPSGVDFCSCKALRWGFWGADIKLSNGDRLRSHLGTWVAGTVSDAASIAGLTGTAVYNGHLIGNVISGTGSSAQTYIAVGGLSVNYDFSSQTGTVSITNFDSTNYTGSISKLASGQEHLLTGTLASSSGPVRTGTVEGAFFVSNGQSNGAMGGDVSISEMAGDYDVAGTFAAHR